MKLRLSIAAALSVGLLPGSAAVGFAADKLESRRPAYGFSTLKTADAASARVKAEAWLKSTGKMDRAAFDKIWSDQSKAVLDRVSQTLVLGNTEAATILAAARRLNGPASASVPSLLKDAKADSFFRSNLALAFAKANANKKAYEEALEALKAITPENVVDPASYFFFKAVCEHALMKRDAAASTITRLLDDVADAPDRYKMVATLMFFDMVNWSPDPKDLGNIEKLMDNSGRRLDLSRPDDRTQDIQKKIVFRLDEVIKELENQSKGGGQCNGGNCPNGGKPGNKPGSTLNPSNPAQDSIIMGGAGAGKVDQKKLRAIADQWGGLPPAERAKVIGEITRDLPAKYKPMIDEYFKSLNRIHGFK